MGQQTASYRVRLARPDEVTRLRAIEDAAGRIFSGLGLIDEALDVSFPLDDLALLVGDEQGWLTTEGFIDKVAENLGKAMAA